MMTSLPPPLRARRVSEDGDSNKVLGHVWKQIKIRMKQLLQLRGLINVCSYKSLSQMKAYRHAVELTARSSDARADNGLTFASGRNTIISVPLSGVVVAIFPTQKDKPPPTPHWCFAAGLAGQGDGITTQAKRNTWWSGASRDPSSRPNFLYLELFVGDNALTRVLHGISQRERSERARYLPLGVQCSICSQKLREKRQSSKVLLVHTGESEKCGQRLRL